MTEGLPVRTFRRSLRFSWRRAGDAGKCLFLVPEAGVPCGVRDYTSKLVSSLRRQPLGEAYEEVPVAPHGIGSAARRIVHADTIVFSFPLRSWSRTVLLPIVLVLLGAATRRRIVLLRDKLVAQKTQELLDCVSDIVQPTGIVTWGLSDKYTWVPIYYKRQDGLPNRPLPWTGTCRSSRCTRSCPNSSRDAGRDDRHLSDDLTDAALLVSYRIVDRFRARHSRPAFGNRSESCWERNSRDWQVHAIVVVHRGDIYPQYSGAEQQG